MILLNLTRLYENNRVANSKEILLLRKHYEPKIVSQKGRKRNLNYSITDQSISYGKPYRPSTPIKVLLSNRYGEEAERRTNSRYEFHSQKRLELKMHKPVRMTRAFDILNEYRNKKCRHTEVLHVYFYL